MGESGGGRRISQIISGHEHSLHGGNGTSAGGSNTLLEGTKIGGEPTGKFMMTQSTALAASKEVLNTHKGLSGDALSAYLDTYFDKAWAHFDVNQSGKIEVIKMPQFMRFVASDQYMQLGESG